MLCMQMPSKGQLEKQGTGNGIGDMGNCTKMLQKQDDLELVEILFTNITRDDSGLTLQ